MTSKKETDYAVRTVLYTGEEIPSNEDLDWFSFGVARKIAAKAWEVRSQVSGSPVKTIQIIDFDYNVVKSYSFEEEE